MSDFVLPGREPNRNLNLDAMPASGLAGFGALVEENVVRGPMETIDRAAARNQIERSVEAGDSIQPVLSRDQANAKYGIDGQLSFDQDTPEMIARQLHQLKRDEIERSETIRRSESGIGTALTAGLVGTILDPLNVASAFIPVVGEARFASIAAKLGTTGARATTGAVEGLVGAAMLEPIVYLGARAEQADYTAVDSLTNLAFGTALGSGLHLVGGFVGDRLRNLETASGPAKVIDSLPRTDQESLLKSAIAQVVEGRPVEIDPVLQAIDRTTLLKRDMEAALRVPSLDEARKIALQELAPALRAELLPEIDARLGTVADTKQELSTLQQRLDGLDDTFKERAREFQSEGMTRKQAEKAAREAVAVDRQDLQSQIVRLQNALETNRRSEIATQETVQLERGQIPERFQSRLEERAQQILAERGQINPLSAAIQAANGANIKIGAGMDAKATMRAIQKQQPAIKAEHKQLAPEDAAALDAVEQRVKSRKPNASAADEISDLEKEVTELEFIATDEQRAAVAADLAEFARESELFERAFAEAATCRIRNAA